MRHIKLLQELIRFKSITPFDDGSMEFIKNLLTELGFVCKIVKFQDEGSEEVLNLYAKLGSKGFNFCFAGHVDVVPSGNPKNWSHDPFAGIAIDGSIYGRGAVDMKGAIAAFIEAVHRASENHSLNNENSISILLTSDEEGIAVDGIKKMIPWLNKHNEKIDACIIGEPTSSKKIGDTIKIGARGSINFTIEIFGKQGHVAYNQFTENPIPILSKIINELKAITLDQGDIYFQPSNLEFTNLFVANNAENVVPASAIANCNIRFGRAHTADSLVTLVNSICNKYTEKFHLSWRGSGEAFLTNHDTMIPKVTEAVFEVMGIKPDVNTFGGTSDARFLTTYCPVVELGLLNDTAHKIDEMVTIEDLENLTQIYLRVLKKFQICD